MHSTKLIRFELELKIAFTILFSFGLLTTCFGQKNEQDKQIDSLKKMTETASHDSIIIQAYIAWDNLIYFADPELDFILNQKIDSLASKNLSNNTNEIEKKFFLKAKAFAQNSFGIIFENKGKYEEAIKYYTNSLNTNEKMGFRQGMANPLNNIGNIYLDKGDFKQAIDYYTRSLKIREEFGSKNGMAQSFNNIGLVYHDQNDFEKALLYHSKSYQLSKEINDLDLMASALISIGNVNYAQENFSKALKNYQECLQIYEEINYSYGVSTALNNIGSIYKIQKDFGQALIFYKKSVELSQELNDPKSLAGSLNNVGNIYFLKGDYAKSIEYSRQSLKLAKEVGAIIEIQAASRNLWQAYKKVGKHKQSLEMYTLTISMRDSIASEENQKAVIRQEYKYQYEKEAAKDSVKNAEAQKVKDAQIDAEQAINERNKIKLKQGKLEDERQTQQMWLLSSVLALALFFGVFIFNRFRVTKKQRDIIDRQKSVVETQKLEVEQQKEKVDEAYEQLEEKNTEILDSINYAKRIQTAILPPDKLVKEYLHDSFILYKPKDIVAGDFYWCEPTENGVLFAAADCTGHGVPGAMVSVVCNNGLNRAVREYGLTEPGLILDKTREIVIAEFEKSEEEVKDGMDIALCSLQGNTLKYAGANNPLWIIRKRKAIRNPEVISTIAEKSVSSKTDNASENRGIKYAEREGNNSEEHSTIDEPNLSAMAPPMNGEMTSEERTLLDYELIEIKADKQPIGKYDEPKPYTTHTIQLQKGDTFYIFSDGYADQFGGESGRPGGKKFKTARFKKLLISIQNESIQRQRVIINETFENWKNAGGQPLEQLDDVCVIGVRI